MKITYTKQAVYAWALTVLSTIISTITCWVLVHISLWWLFLAIPMTVYFWFVIWVTADWAYSEWTWKEEEKS